MMYSSEGIFSFGESDIVPEYPVHQCVNVEHASTMLHAICITIAFFLLLTCNESTGLGAPETGV